MKTGDLPLKNWVPYELKNIEGQMECRWLNTYGKPFAEPFFDETILMCKGLAGKHVSINSVSNLAMMEEWGSLMNAITPAAIIFHISRCGSTLVTQQLATSDSYLILSEVPFFDSLLRLPFEDKNYSQAASLNLLKTAINFYGQKKTGHIPHLFLKTDSWHIFFHKQLRALYPAAPFILMYRRPDEVFRSHKKVPGIHTVRGLIEPEILGFNPDEINIHDRDLYISKVLESYLNKFNELIKTDKRFLLVNYNEGPMAIIKKIAAFTNINLSEKKLPAMKERSQYHSKKPYELFQEEAAADCPVCLKKAAELYDLLEKKRNGA